MQVSAECRGVRPPQLGVLGTELTGPQEEQGVLLTLELSHQPLVVQADLELKFFWFQPSWW